MADYLLQHQLVNSASRFPDRLALSFCDESLTYRELDQLTNQIANSLVESGVKEGDRVGIYLNKSLQSVVSIFGILKAGAAYVPLDPQSPVERLSYIVDNCGIGFILTSTAKQTAVEALVENCAYLRGIVFTDEKKPIEISPQLEIIEWTSILRFDCENSPEVKTNETDLAYILYTSGSTGTPKGVMISHLNSLTFVRWACETLSPTSEDRFSNHAPLHFDLSILDIFCAARSGAALFPVPESLSMFPVRLGDWIEKNEISIWYSVPSILSMLLLHGKLDDKRFEKLRTVLYAGEVFPVKYLRNLMCHIPDAEFFNLYGPTETNVITYYKTPVLSSDQEQPVPIGKCCENMGVFILDEEGCLVTEAGVEGELMARGSNVAMGYWGDVEKTRKYFVDNPIQVNFRDTIYKTGDLVMLDEEGNYIFKGRKDHMIKSRGYRIEIGEIEAALYASDLIKEAAVVAIPDDLITNRIKAFVVLKDAETMDASDVRASCGNRVPKYMVPETVEFRESLPKTSTGKVNKPALIKETIEGEEVTVGF